MCSVTQLQQAENETALTILYMYCTSGTEMPQLHTWQSLSMCRQSFVRGQPEGSLHQERTYAEWLSQSKCLELSLMLEYRCLRQKQPKSLYSSKLQQPCRCPGSDSGDCRPFHFPLFSPRNTYTQTSKPANSGMARAIQQNKLLSKMEEVEPFRSNGETYCVPPSLKLLPHLIPLTKPASIDP